MALFMGCPMWQHPDWLFQKQMSGSKLSTYAQFFNTVEGNTTFYSLPNDDIAKSWQAIAQMGFQFSFKFPRAVTHDGHWQNCADYERFMTLLGGFSQLGPVQIQLPNRFDRNQLGQLAGFLAQLPADFRYSVEVRHLDFFDKNITEQTLNRMLQQEGVGRTLFDTRALFHMPADTPEVIDGQQKKPRVPLHVVSTAQHVLVRYIGPADFAANERWFTPWVGKIQQWLAQGKDIYLFAHTPDNVMAPQLALDMQQAITGMGKGQETLALALPQQGLF